MAENGSAAVSRKVESATRSVNNVLSEPAAIKGEINEWRQLRDKLFLSK